MALVAPLFFNVAVGVPGQTAANHRGRNDCYRVTARCSTFLGSRGARLVQASRATRSKPAYRARLQIQANELNKWGDTDGRDSDTEPGKDDDGFDRDTSFLITRVLTSRATQRVLMHLQEVNLQGAQWLMSFCSENPPIDGNKFLKKLFKAKVQHVEDKTNQKTHFINPANLANRILLIREDMAKSVSQALPNYVTLDNLQVMREHIMDVSYTSGSHDGAKGAKGQAGTREAPRRRRR